jgi:hypothetical protein
MSGKRIALATLGVFALLWGTTSLMNGPSRPSALSPTVVHAQSTDPCATGVKSSVLFTMNSNAVVLPGVSGKHTYVCGIALSARGTEPNFSFVQGTGSTCSTGFTTLGIMFPGANNGFWAGGDNTQFTLATGSDLCGIVSGTDFNGWLTYIQQ